MRPAAIAVVGLICLAFIVIFIAFVQLILLCLALIVCLPIALGFLWQGHKQRAFWIPTIKRTDATEPPPSNAVLNIEGNTFLVHDLPSRLEFKVSCRNLHVLTAITLIALGAALVSLFGTDSLMQHIEPASTRYFEFYFLCYFMVMLLLLALAWLSECALMRGPSITLANIGGHGRGGLGTLWVGYQFTDLQGGYYGGSAMDVGGPKDDQLKVVFYNPRNPGLNKL